MLGDLPALAADVAARIRAQVPGLEAPEVVELVGTMCEANGAMVLDGLVRDIEPEAVDATPDFLRWTQAIAQHRIPLPSLLRAYRVSHARWWEIWIEQVDERVAPEHAAAVAAAGSRYLFGWADLLSDQATIEYVNEARRLAQQASVAQAGFVRGVLNADPHDLAGASTRLGYDLGGRHLATVLKAPAGDEMTDALLERAARGLADACGGGRPLAVLVDSRTAWVWVAIGPDVEIPRTVSGPARAGVGRPGRGLGGFRASHGEALEASRIAELTERPRGSVTRYGAVELAALCARDVEACRRFVRSNLGALAVADDQSRRLLATLQAFFREGSNYRATARRLGVHHNTIVYRVAQSEELLGHPLAEGRIQLELALELAAILGDVVLAD